jgi:uncharacterized protein YbjQ (UPF0145 family)
MGWFSGSNNDILVTTTSDFGSTKTITEYFGVVTGEAIIGANIFRDMFSSVRDVVGGRAGGYERALAGARGDALTDLKNAAKEIGANAIVGVDFDYEVMGEANGMMMVAVSGTAVRIE